MGTRSNSKGDGIKGCGIGQRLSRRLGCGVALLFLVACKSPVDVTGEESTPIRIAHLARDDGDVGAMAVLRSDFERRNPGYALDWHRELREYRAGARSVVGFVQSGTARVTVKRVGGQEVGSDPSIQVGDVILLRPTESLVSDSALSVLIYTVPTALPDELPSFVRPDWDERITDTPGGCAEETGAYRRILLTWKDEVGPYVYHALNCHRVRITDSFAHYHPIEGGFDEFYLVQMAQPGAVIYTSEATARIEDPHSVTAQEAKHMFDTHALTVGDLVYLPRGTVHRGFGGVLAQIISVPGFRPGAEVGVDHHLREINEQLGLEGADALPFREASSTQAVIK